MTLISTKSLASLAIPHGFFTREDGLGQGVFVSRNVSYTIGDDPKIVDENRRRCLSELGLASGPLIFAGGLAHSNKVYCATNVTKSLDIEGFDAVITNQPGVAIGLSTADCIPIFLADEDYRAVAVIHAGWRGLKAEVIAETVKSLHKKYDISAHTLVAAIGPAIAVDSYQFGEDALKFFDQKNTKKVDGTLHLDIINIAKQQLKELGVKQIDTISHDTYSDKRYFSYRRDAGETGRQLSAILLPLPLRSNAAVTDQN